VGVSQEKLHSKGRGKQIRLPHTPSVWSGITPWRDGLAGIPQKAHRKPTASIVLGGGEGLTHSPEAPILQYCWML